MSKKKTESLSERLTDLAIVMLKEANEHGWSEDHLREVKRLLDDARKASMLGSGLFGLSMVWVHLLDPDDPEPSRA